MDNGKIDFKTSSLEYLKCLLKEREDIVIVDKSYSKYINSNEAVVIEADNKVCVKNFIETFLICYKLNKGFNDQVNLLKSFNNVIKFIDNRRLIVTTVLSENVYNEISNFLNKPDIFENNDEYSKKTRIYFLQIFDFFIKICFDKLKVIAIFSVIEKILVHYSKNLYLKDKSSLIVLNAVELLESGVTRNIEALVYSTGKFKNQEIVKDFLKYFNEEFYYEIYSVENIRVRNLVKNIIDNKYPLVNSIPLEDKCEDVKELINPLTNTGRFGVCSQCASKADFYCRNTRLPICSLQCKNSAVFKEHFMDFLDVQDILLDRDKFDRSQGLAINFLDNTRKCASSMILTIIKIIKGLELGNSKTSEKSMPSDYIYTKVLMDLINKLFKINKYLFNPDYFQAVIKKGLVKILVKIVYIGDVQLASLSLDILLFSIKYYMRVMKEEIKHILLEILKLLNGDIICNYKARLLLKFLKELLVLYNGQSIALFFSNFDIKPTEENVAKNLIETLHHQLINLNRDPTCKSLAISCLQTIIKNLVVPFNSTNIPAINFKINYSACRDAFNSEPKKILDVINEKGLNTDGVNEICFLANFLRFGNLNKEKIGEYLGKNEVFNKSILKAYLETFNFSRINIADALRRFLYCFSIPGEGQIISRIMEEFSIKYYNDNQETEISQIIENSDAVFYLSNNIIILHTYL